MSNFEYWQMAYNEGWAFLDDLTWAVENNEITQEEKDQIVAESNLVVAKG
ncbi:hypothetical protein [Brevibacillus sp. SYSU BS000544]